MPSARSPGSFLLLFVAYAGLVLGLPALGAWMAAVPLDPCLRFPPRPLAVHPPGFSATYACLVAALGLATLAVWLVWPRCGPPGGRTGAAGRFPTWGWLACTALAGSWIVAWTRIPALDRVQPYSFIMLWLSAIGVIQALQVRFAGRSHGLDRPACTLGLFATGALFWWSFEYLNILAHNWYYVGADGLSDLEYAFRASLAFSTVLPAVVGLQQLILDMGFLRDFDRRMPLAGPRTDGVLRILPGAVLLGAGLSLAALPRWPEVLFPLVWVSPLLVILALESLAGREHLLSRAAGGDWSQVNSAILAGLACGLLWEMWNFFSHPKWIYTVPFVSRFHIFEMPVLGYLGYVPFGLECVAVGTIVEGWIEGRPEGNTDEASQRETV